MVQWLTCDNIQHTTCELKHIQVLKPETAEEIKKKAKFKRCSIMTNSHENKSGLIQVSHKLLN